MDLEKNKWEYYSPTFEFTEDLPPQSSAWSGHYFFAYDLIRNTKPKVVVELGTHKGNSLFSMAQAIKDGKLQTELHAIDTWEGDHQAGLYGDDVYKEFLRILEEYYKDIQVIPHKMPFDDALKNFEDNSIEILHIDGLHTYEAVKHDFETWLPKVNKDTGIIMFHDVCETKDDFGVYKLWDELKKKYENTITFEHYHGLGVIFFKQQDEIFPQHYTTISEKEDLKVENSILREENSKKREENEILKTENNKIFVEHNKLIKKYNKQRIEVEEFRGFKKGKIWNTLQKYRKIKKKMNPKYEK